MAMITNDWLTALGGEFHKPYYRQLFEFVKDEYNTTVVFPPADDIFNAFHLTPLSKVKVVILGQDPYHNVGLDIVCTNIRGEVDNTVRVVPACADPAPDKAVERGFRPAVKVFLGMAFV